MHRFFSEVPQFGSLRSLPKTDLEKNETATGCKIAWLRYTSRIMEKTIADFRRFGAKEPRHSETILVKKGYASIVARVEIKTAPKLKTAKKKGGYSRE